AASEQDARNNPAAAPNPPATASLSAKATEEPVAKQEPATEAGLKDAAPEQSSQAPALQENGSQELAMAQHYLNGTRASARDSSEAAKWLWQSVRKENTAATLMLSDLYLKGDGVPK